MSVATPFLRRAGLIGDVHAENESLAAVLDFLQNQEPPLDALLCTGDVVTGHGDASACIDLLRTPRVYTVRGNHDRWFLRDVPRMPGVGYDTLEDATPDDEVMGDARTWLASLPFTLSFATSRGPLLLCHGTGTDDMLAVYPHDSDLVLGANHKLHALHAEGHYRLIVGGHTHRRMLRPFDHLILINPGALRRDHRRSEPGFLIADFEAGTLSVFDIAPDGRTITAGDMHPLPVTPSPQTAREDT